MGSRVLRATLIGVVGAALAPATAGAATVRTTFAGGLEVRAVAGEPNELLAVPPGSRTKNCIGVEPALVPAVPVLTLGSLPVTSDKPIWTKSSSLRVVAEAR